MATCSRPKHSGSRKEWTGPNVPKLFRGKRRKFVFIFFLVAASFMYSLMYISLTQSRWNIPRSNYFELDGEREILIDLPGCLIPWERKPREPKEVLEKPNCDRNRPKYTYVEKNKIFVNASAKHAACCYKGIVRVFGTDDKYKVAKTCHQIDSRTGTQVEKFSMVAAVCDVHGRVYNDYHFIVQSKGNYQKNLKSPNIVIIGIDSVSRFHFQTMMPKTRKYLQSLGSFELVGYTKVGENTFPNAIAFLTGYKEEQTLKFCYNRTRPIDFCPMIWQNLRMNTAFLEDAPHIGIFNYFKFGFLHPPADHYLRPLMLRVSTEYSPLTTVFPCTGSRTTEQFVLEGIGQLLKYEQPLFLFSWLTSLAHEGRDLLPYGDDIFSSWLPTLDLSNTILVLMADHGFRYGSDRPSFNGWYNDKLPFFTMTFPESVKAVLGKERLEALEANTRKLTTAFDFYHTLVDILKLYDLKDFENEASVPVGDNVTQDKDIQRLYGQSLFTPIPSNRNCSASGIPSEFCACSNLEPISVHSALIEDAAKTAVAEINGFLPRRCRHLELSQITAGAKLSEETFIVGFTVKPGNFQYEAYFPFKGKLRSSRIQRTNKISETWCLYDWFYVYYCYCDLFGFVFELISGSKI